MAPQARRAGIKDVAERAGVSLTTVSHVLSGRRPVAEATRQRVEQAVRELGYRPNKAAQSLMSRRSHTMALIVPDITNPFYPALARGMLDVLEQNDYALLIGNSNGDPAREREIVGQMLERGVDALAFAGYRADSGQLQAIVDAGLPAVAFGIASPLPGIDVISSDDLGGGRLAARFLLDQGRRCLAFIAGPDALELRPERIRGYELATSGGGCESHIVHVELSRDGGAAGLRELHERGIRPDGVVANNDIVALGVLDVARESGMRVPEELAVVGFDDIDIAALVWPALTTIRVPAHEQGHAGAELLLARINGDESPSKALTFATSLVRRQSA